MKDLRWAAAIATILGCLQTAGADPFCIGIRAVVADARNAFDDLRGEQTDQKRSTVEPYYTIDYFAARGWPEGAQTCYIERRDEPTRDGHRFPNYYCEYPVKAGTKAKALRRLAGRIAACVKGASKPVADDPDNIGGMLSWHERDVHFSAFAGPSSPNIRVLIQANDR